MTPEQVQAQRRAALDKANTIRMANAHFKAECAEGTTAEACAIVADALRSSDAGTIERMKIRHLLECIPRVGNVRVATILQRAGIVNSDRPVRMVSTRQRLSLAEQVTALGERWRHDTRTGPGEPESLRVKVPLLGTTS